MFYCSWVLWRIRNFEGIYSNGGRRIHHTDNNLTYLNIDLDIFKLKRIIYSTSHTEHKLWLSPLVILITIRISMCFFVHPFRNIFRVIWGDISKQMLGTTLNGTHTSNCYIHSVEFQTERIEPSARDSIFSFQQNRHAWIHSDRVFLYVNECYNVENVYINST